MGEPSRVLIAANEPAAPITVTAIAGASSPDEVDQQDGEACAHRHERRLRAEHRPGHQGGECGDDDPWKIDRGVPAPRLEAEDRDVPSGPRQVDDRQRDDHSTDDQQRDRPPHRRADESDLFRKGRVQPLLSECDPFEEEVGDERDRNPDDRPEEQQDHVALRLHQRQWIGRRRRRSRGRRRSGRHRASLGNRPSPQTCTARNQSRR